MSWAALTAWLMPPCDMPAIHIAGGATAKLLPGDAFVVVCYLNTAVKELKYNRAFCRLAFPITSTHCRPRRRTKERLPGEALVFVHDLAVTEHYYIVVMPPLRLDYGRCAYPCELRTMGVASE